MGRVRAVPCLCVLYPGICLTTEEKARKTLSQGSWRVPVGTMKTEYTEQYTTIRIHKHNNKNTISFDCNNEIRERATKLKRSRPNRYRSRERNWLALLASHTPPVSEYGLSFILCPWSGLCPDDRRYIWPKIVRIAGWPCAIRQIRQRQ